MRATHTNFNAIDLGSSKISILAAKIDNNLDARVGYQGVFYSEGIKSGIITDLKLTENSIINAIYHLEQEIGKNIKDISVSISGLNAKSYYIFQKINLNNEQVTRKNLDDLIERAIESFHIEDKSIIHYFPVEYALDQNNSIQNPIGMYGTCLGVRLHIIVADTNQISNIVNCFANCHISVKEIILGVYASGIACLTEDEKALGSVVIDFGAKTTSFGIFLGGQLLYTGYVNIGGMHITSDIARVLSISMESAEKIKVLYGSAISSSIDRDNIINLDEFERNLHYEYESTINANDLSKIIAARVEEILELIKEEYDKVGIDHLIARRIVLTGGGSELRGLKDILSNYFTKQVRIGKPQNIPGFSTDYSSLPFSSVIGLVKNEINNIKKAGSDGRHNANMLSKIVNWIKENV